MKEQMTFVEVQQHANLRNYYFDDLLQFSSVHSFNQESAVVAVLKFHSFVAVSVACWQ